MSKSIWECSITVHWSIKEKNNSVLLSMAQDEKSDKKKIAQQLIETHPNFIKKMKEMEENGFFI